MGKSNFDKLRDTLILPCDRTLRMYRSKNVPFGSGVNKTILYQVRKQFENLSKSCYDVILSWDATGYAKNLFFNKDSGELEGFVCDPESFSMHHMFANKVNCFYISSPEEDIIDQIPNSVLSYHDVKF